PSCCRAASACPIATTTSIRRRKWPTSAPSIRRTSPRSSSWCTCRTRAHGPSACSRSSTAWPRRTPRAPTPRTCARAITTGHSRTSRHGRRAWTAFFAAAGLGAQREFVVWQPGAVSVLSALTASQPLEVWQDYLRFHLIERNSAYLPRAFVEEHFAFHSRVLQGTPQQRPRWKRAVDETSDALGEAVGKLYVERYFPPSEKARAEAMVRNLIAVFATRIDRLEWMAPATREKAKAKLAALRVGV